MSIMRNTRIDKAVVTNFLVNLKRFEDKTKITDVLWFFSNDTEEDQEIQDAVPEIYKTSFTPRLSNREIEKLEEYAKTLRVLTGEVQAYYKSMLEQYYFRKRSLAKIIEILRGINDPFPEYEKLIQLAYDEILGIYAILQTILLSTTIGEIVVKDIVQATKEEVLDELRYVCLSIKHDLRLSA